MTSKSTSFSRQENYRQVGETWAEAKREGRLGEKGERERERESGGVTSSFTGATIIAMVTKCLLS